MKTRILVAIAALLVAQAHAQLVEPNQIGLRMGHVHLAVKDVNAQKEFLVSVLGGRVVANGAMQLIEFPGTYVALLQADAAPATGASLDHFGFIVKDMPAQLARWKASGVTIRPTDNPNEVFLIGPEGVRVEVYGEPALPTDISLNHLHYLLVDGEIPAIKAWYVKAFGANPSRRACVACVANPRMYEAGDLPGGVNLTFAPRRAPPPATVGRAIDHIGFEVQHLDAFIKGLKARGIRMDGPVRKIPGTNIRAAFLTDPWGTRIELTEGLPPG